MRASGAVLSVKGVTKRFGGLVAVSGMSFDVAQHEMVGVIGPNGSGKTTMLNMISGAFKPTEGRISLKGRVISDLPAAKDRPRRGGAHLPTGAPSARPQRS